MSDRTVAQATRRYCEALGQHGGVKATPLEVRNAFIDLIDALTLDREDGGEEGEIERLETALRLARAEVAAANAEIDELRLMISTINQRRDELHAEVVRLRAAVAAIAP